MTDSRPVVLAVDDTPSNLDLLHAALSEDYKVKVATGGAKARGIVLSPMDVRRHVAELIEPAFPELVVLCPEELLPTTAVHTRAVIEAA